jgi:hypothetical protein
MSEKASELNVYKKLFCKSIKPFWKIRVPSPHVHELDLFFSYKQPLDILNRIRIRYDSFNKLRCPLEYFLNSETN